VYDVSQLTGALVAEVRGRYGLSRARFSELAGLPGKSTARIYNIETKNSWRDNDRALVAALLARLENGEITATRSSGARPAPTPAPQPVEPTYDETGALAVPPVTVSLDIDYDEVSDNLTIVFPSPPAVPQDSRWEQRFTSFIFDEQPTPGVPAFSNSEFQTWKRCRRKWWLGWYRGLQLQTQDFTSVRATGTRIHRALERWYVPEGQPRVDPRDALERVIVEDWTRITELAAKRQTHEEQVTQLAVDFTAATNLERAMIEGYVQWLAETGEDAELRVIGSEVPLIVDTEVDVPGYGTRGIQFIGLLDAPVRRITDNAQLFIDHKTVGDLASPLARLPQNEQMLHYHLLQFLSSDDAEERCDGALYNMLRRVKRSPRAKPPFYSRVEVRHNKHELESYRRRALAAAADIIKATDRLSNGEDHLEVVYPTPAPDCAWSCDFAAVCNLFDDGSHAEAMLSMLYQTGNPRARYERKGSDS
jgi:hypothetical protein